MDTYTSLETFQRKIARQGKHKGGTQESTFDKDYMWNSSQAKSLRIHVEPEWTYHEKMDLSLKTEKHGKDIELTDFFKRRAEI